MVQKIKDVTNHKSTIFYNLHVMFTVLTTWYVNYDIGYWIVYLVENN